MIRDSGENAWSNGKPTKLSLVLRPVRAVQRSNHLRKKVEAYISSGDYRCDALPFKPRIIQSRDAHRCRTFDHQMVLSRYAGNSRSNRGFAHQYDPVYQPLNDWECHR